MYKFDTEAEYVEVQKLMFDEFPFTKNLQLHKSMYLSFRKEKLFNHDINDKL